MGIVVAAALVIPGGPRPHPEYLGERRLQGTRVRTDDDGVPQPTRQPGRDAGCTV
jgi:hypothetical protein